MVTIKPPATQVEFAQPGTSNGKTEPQVAGKRHVAVASLPRTSPSFSELDKDQDGRLSLAEYKAGFPNVPNVEAEFKGARHQRRWLPEHRRIQGWPPRSALLFRLPRSAERKIEIAVHHSSPRSVIRGVRIRPLRPFGGAFLFRHSELETGDLFAVADVEIPVGDDRMIEVLPSRVH